MPVGTSASVSALKAKVAALAATNAQTATLPKAVNATRSVTQAQIATLPRQTVKPMLLTVVTVPTKTTGFQHLVTLATTVHAGQTPPASKTLICSSATSATLATVHLSNKTLSATQAQTALLARQVGKIVQTGTGMALPPIFTSVSPTASLTSLKTAGSLSLTASQPSVAVVNKRPAKTFTAASGSLAALTSNKVQQLKTLTATVGQSVTLPRQILKVPAAVSATAASFQRLVAKAVTASVTTTETVTKGRRILLLLAGTANQFASVTGVFVISPGPPLIVPISGPGTLTFSPAPSGTITFTPENPTSLGLINPSDPTPR